MAAVAKLLVSARLVTLVGAAGVGKTRLAIQVASAAFELHDEGASLARLAPVDDPSLVAAAVAAAVGVREQPGRLMVQALISHQFHPSADPLGRRSGSQPQERGPLGGRRRASGARKTQSGRRR